MGRRRTEDEIYETCCADISEMMARLLEKYRSYPKFVALTMADSLAAFISITADQPQKGLDSVAKRIQTTDYNQVRLRHFGWKLGVPADQGDINERSTSDGREKASESAPDRNLGPKPHLKGV